MLYAPPAQDPLTQDSRAATSTALAGTGAPEGSSGSPVESASSPTSTLVASVAPVSGCGRNWLSASKSLSGPGPAGQVIDVGVADGGHCDRSQPDSTVRRSEERRVGKEGRSRWAP